MSAFAKACTGAADAIFWTGYFASLMTVCPLAMLFLIGSEKFRNPFK